MNMMQVENVLMPIWATTAGRRCYISHVQSIGEEKKGQVAGKKTYRKMVEMAHLWFSKFMQILVGSWKVKLLFEELLHLAPPHHFSEN